MSRVRPFSARERSVPVLSLSHCSPGMERAGLQRPEGEAGRLLPLLPLLPQVRGAGPAPPRGGGRAVPCPRCLPHGETGAGAVGHLCHLGRPHAWRVGCSREHTGTQASGESPWLRAGGRQRWGGTTLPHSAFPLPQRGDRQWPLRLLQIPHPGHPPLSVLAERVPLHGEQGEGHAAPRCPAPRSLNGPYLLPFPSGSSSTGTGSVASPSALSSLRSPGSSSTSTSPM